MIHKIKGLYDQGNGLSIRAISRELNISRNTVRKYLQMDQTQISACQDDRSRQKLLDTHRDFLIHQLKRFPKLSAVKLARRLQERCAELDVSSRSIRRYVQALKAQVATGQLRYYEPVPQSVPGVQCQVDPGELEDAMVHPEKYPDLIVRVSGFSAVFVDLDRAIQEELISRVLYDEESK